jgi:hypothetical protein
MKQMEYQPRARILRAETDRILDLKAECDRSGSLIDGRGNSAPPAEPTGSAMERLFLKGRKQESFEISILELIEVILGGLSLLIAQAQLGYGRGDTGMLIIRGQDGEPRAKLSKLNGQVSLRLLDNEGKTRAEVSIDSSENPNFCRLYKP